MTRCKSRLLGEAMTYPLGALSEVVGLQPARAARTYSQNRFGGDMKYHLASMSLLIAACSNNR